MKSLDINITDLKIAILGLGEAGAHFANDLVKLGVQVVGYDPNPIRPLAAAVGLKTSNAEAACEADVVFSVNLSSVSEEVAQEVAAVLQPWQFYCEMNTSGPQKKQKIANILKNSGVKMIDLAIMAPVPPAGIMTPFLASGTAVDDFYEKVKPLGLQLKILENSQIGEAATRKLLRSIVYKGIAAVVCEAMEAGQAFGMETYIRGQISSLIGGNDELIDRFVEGSHTHAVRRMHEMEAVMELATHTPHDEMLELIMTKATRDNLNRLATRKTPSQKTTPSNVEYKQENKAIPYMQLRGGSSKGLYFKAEDLPTDEHERNQLLLLAMEGTTHGDPRQIDGLGGATSLTSKVAIVSSPKNSEADLDYLFVQVVVGKGKISTTQTCGNILAGILPFALEAGLLKATHPTTTAKIKLVNTGSLCEVTIPTPNGKVSYQGDARVDGVPGTAAPIVCHYLETVGSTCGALLPTDHAKDLINGIEVTCIDNGMPIVVLRAADFGLTGNETKETLEANVNLRNRLEDIRLKAGFMMNLGDVKDQTIPKMCLVSPPQKGGMLNTRMFIPHVVHEAIGVLAAVSVATACVIPHTVIEGIAGKDLVTPSPDVQQAALSIEHPTGEFTVQLEYHNTESGLEILKSGVIRTARLLSKGELYVPLSST